MENQIEFRERTLWHISEQIETTATKFIQEVLVVNQLVCKNRSLPTSCQPQSSTPWKSSKIRAQARKRNQANGSYVNTADKSTHAGPHISDCGKRGDVYRLFLLLALLPSLLLKCLRTAVIPHTPSQILITDKSTPHTPSPHPHIHPHPHTPTPTHISHLQHLFVKALSGKEHHSFVTLSLWLFVFWQCRNSPK